MNLPHLEMLKKRLKAVSSHDQCQTEVLQFFFNFAMDCEHDNNSWLERSKRYAARKCLKQYYDFPERQKECWSKEFIRRTKKAIAYLVEIDKTKTEEAWITIIQDALYEQVINLEAMRIFFTAIVQIGNVQIEESIKIAAA